MIPTVSSSSAMSSPTFSSASAPGSGSLRLFHVIIDDSARLFFLSGPDGPNGVRVHYEVELARRKRGVKLREADIRADALDQVLALLGERLPGYRHQGAWMGSAT
jgi:hypothetical protein